MEATRKRGRIGRFFAIAVVVVVSFPTPVFGEIKGESAIGGLIL